MKLNNLSFSTIKKDNWKDWKTYQYYIQKLPGLSRLISSPFVLSLLVQVLPEIITKYQSEEDKNNNNIEQLKLVRINLYDHFIERWFSRRKQKLLNSRQISYNCPIVEAFLQYSESLAKMMFKKNVTSVKYIPKTTNSQEFFV